MQYEAGTVSGHKDIGNPALEENPTNLNNNQQREITIKKTADAKQSFCPVNVISRGVDCNQLLVD
jgi:hypothetical protein